MSIRRDPIYISRDVWSALRLLSKKEETQLTYNVERATVTVDYLADKLLRELIQKEYPQLFEHQKQIDKLERELIKTLGET